MKREFPEIPFVGVGAIIIEDARVVLVKRAHPPLQAEWSIPGGVLEVGELVREAAVREAREEIRRDQDRNKPRERQREAGIARRSRRISAHRRPDDGASPLAALHAIQRQAARPFRFPGRAAPRSRQRQG